MICPEARMSKGFSEAIRTIGFSGRNADAAIAAWEAEETNQLGDPSETPCLN